MFSILDQLIIVICLTVVGVIIIAIKRHQQSFLEQPFLHFICVVGLVQFYWLVSLHEKVAPVFLEWFSIMSLWALTFSIYASGWTFFRYVSTVVKRRVTYSLYDLIPIALYMLITLPELFRFLPEGIKRLYPSTFYFVLISGFSLSCLYAIMALMLLIQNKDILYDDKEFIFSYKKMYLLTWFFLLIWASALFVLVVVTFLPNAAAISNAIVHIRTFCLTLMVVYLANLYWQGKTEIVWNEKRVWQPDDNMIQAIDNRVRNEKLYRNHHVALADLARACSMTEAQLSLVLNRYYEKNFFSYINDLRLADAEGLLKQNDKNTLQIQQISSQVGFSSRSSFNTLFKKRTGLTPRQYRQRYQKKNTEESDDVE